MAKKKLKAIGKEILLARKRKRRKYKRLVALVFMLLVLAAAVFTRIPYDVRGLGDMNAYCKDGGMLLRNDTAADRGNTEIYAGTRCRDYPSSACMISCIYDIPSCVCQAAPLDMMLTP
ncbi:MAG: hypothetical protein V1887_02665 [Candidatus Aenigmatarchaeota archaeon]